MERSVVNRAGAALVLAHLALALPTSAGADGADRAAVSLVAVGPERGPVRSRQAIQSPTLLLDRYAGTPVRVTVARSGPGAWAVGGRVLVRPSGVLGAEAFRRALAGAPRLGEAAPLDALVSDFTLIFQAPGPRTRDLTAEMWSQNLTSAQIPELARPAAWARTVTSAEGELLLVETGAAPSPEPLPTDPGLWQRRDLLVSRVADPAGADLLHLVARPLGDPARMLTAGRLARDYAGGPGAALLLDAGMAWPGGLTPDERDVVAATRREAAFDAALPCAADLADGPRELAARRDEQGIPFVAANLVAAGGGPVVEPAVIRQVGGLRVAVVGLVDPALLDAVPQVAAAGLAVLDPATAARAAIDRVRAQADPPDVVVLLANLDAEGTARLRAAADGADVLVGDWSRLGLVAPDEVADFPGRTPAEERSFHRQPTVVARASAADVVRIDLAFDRRHRGGHALRQARTRAVAVTDDAAPDPGLVRVVAARLARQATSDGAVLLPDLDAVARVRPELAAEVRALPDLYPTLPPAQRQGYPLRFTDTLFTRLAVNALRHATRAEVAVVRHIVRAGDAPGEVAVGEVARWLEREPDRAVVLELTGDRLTALHRALAGSDAAWSGLAVRKDGVVLVGGRPALAAEPYRVLVGDSVAASPAAVAAIGPAPRRTRFRRTADGLYEPDDRGEPQPLRQLVPAALSDLELVRDTDRFAALLEVQGGAPTPGFRLRIQGLDLRGGALNRGGAPEPGFSDARLTAGPASAVGGTGEIAADLDGQALSGTVGFKFTYDAQVTVDQRAGASACQVTLNDDWVGAAEGRNRLWALPVGFEAVPYARVSYDSQFFCPPRQKLLFYGTGVGGAPGALWQDVRAGFAVRHDLEHDEVRPGGQAGSRVSSRVGPVLWTAELAVDWFPGSDATALEVDGRLANALDVPVGGGLAFRTRVDSLAYVVGEAAGEGLRHSLTFGLTYDRTIKPWLGLW